MSGKEFLDRLRNFAQRNHLAYRFEAAHGKGSHGRVYLGVRYTTVKDRRKDIGKGLLSQMCRDLGISVRDLMDQ